MPRIHLDLRVDLLLAPPRQTRRKESFPQPGNSRAAALCRRLRLADRGRCYDNYEYAFFVGFNGTLKAYMKKKSTTTMMTLLIIRISTQH